MIGGKNQDYFLIVVPDPRFDPLVHLSSIIANYSALPRPVLWPANRIRFLATPVKGTDHSNEIRRIRPFRPRRLATEGLL